MNDEPTTFRILTIDQLSAQQRMRRICELLSKAVVRDCASRITVANTRVTVSREVRSLGRDASDRDRVLNYIALVGEARTTVIRETLGLSRVQLHRAIQPLVASGRVVASGQSRATAYRLSEREAAKAALN